jgi:peptide/nickel transport system permease protein
MNRRFIFRRAVQGIITLVVAIAASYALMVNMPGGALEATIERLVTEYDYTREQARRAAPAFLPYDPTLPWWEQLINFMVGTAQGDLGDSVLFQRPVLDVYLEALPWTMFVSINSIIIGTITSWSSGVFMAYYEGSRFDVGLTGYAMFFGSIPYYVTALLLLFVLGIEMDLFPLGGHYPNDVTPSLTLGYITGLLHHIALPIASFVIGAGLAGLGMRANAIRVLGEDFMRVARLRGLSDFRIAFYYLLPNAFLPMYAGLLLMVMGLFGGSVIMEQIFNYPGMGLRMFQAAEFRDVPLLAAGMIFFTTASVVIMFIVDLTYDKVDPRADSITEVAESEGRVISWRTVRRIKYGLRRLFSRSGPQARTDGGMSRMPDDDLPDSVFTTRAEEALTRTERLKKWFAEGPATTARIVWDDYRARIGMSIFSIFLFMATFALVITPAPRLNQAPRLQPWFHDGWFTPNPEIVQRTYEPFALTVPDFVAGLHPVLETIEIPLIPGFTFPQPVFFHTPLGTTQVGYDIVAVAVHSTPNILIMGVSGATFAITLGTVLGTAASYKGGIVDRVVTTTADTAGKLGGLPMLIILITLFPVDNPVFLGIVLSFTAWAGWSRTVRAQTLGVREESYVEASKALGMGTLHILRRDFLPNLAPLALLNFIGSMRGVVFAIVGLYYLRVLETDTPNWGVMLQNGYETGAALASARAVHWFAVPVAIIILYGISLMLLAQSLDRVFNPRLRARHEDAEIEEDDEFRPESGKEGGAAGMQTAFGD